MKYMANILKHRVQILEGYQNATGMSFKQKFRRLIRIYAGIKSVNKTGSGGIQPERHENTADIDTHEFIVRYDSVVGRTERAFGDGFDIGYESNYSEGMGRAFDRGFSDGFDSIIDINPVKINHYVYFEHTSAYNGRMFRINRVIRDDDYQEWALLKCSEIFEKGTGASDYDAN